MREDQLLSRFSAPGLKATDTEPGARAAGAEAAFAELVRRHLDFVYSVCQRKVGSREMAQDLTQSVFLILAAKADTLGPGTVLSGWLFQTAHLACQNALRTEARRQYHEHQAMREGGREMEEAAHKTAEGLSVNVLTSRTVSAAWGQIEPALDDALAQLSASDRDALLLRFVEELSPGELAVALGTSAAAAQKRVSRALERLRRRLTATGGAVSIAVLSLFLAEKMVQAAPPALGAVILAAAGQMPPGTVLGTVLGPATSGSHVGGHWHHSAALTKAQGLLAASLLGVAGLSAVVLFSVAATRAVRTAPRATVPSAAKTLHGTVLGSGGAPAANIAVTVLRYAVSDGIWRRFADARTDRAGRYAALGVISQPDPPDAAQPNQWMVIADSGASVGFGVPDAPCRLLPPTQIRLHLAGAQGQPLPAVTLQPLTLFRTDADGRQVTIPLGSGCPLRLVVRTDRAGNALFSGLPQGFAATFAVLDKRYERRPPAGGGLPLIDGPDSGTYTVPVAQGASVAGRLRYGASGLPAAGVRIGAQEMQTSAWGEAQTDAAGRYQIQQLSPGRYTVAVDEESAALGGGWTAAAIPKVALRPGQEAGGLEMTLAAGVLITGKVTQHGRPVSGTEIGAYGPAHPASGAWVSGGWTQADGTYQIRVPPGRHHVYPMALPGAAGTDIVVQDSQKAVVNFAFPE